MTMCVSKSRGASVLAEKNKGLLSYRQGLWVNMIFVRLDSSHIQLWARIAKFDFKNLFLQKLNEFKRYTGFEIDPCGFMNESITNMWYRAIT